MGGVRMEWKEVTLGDLCEISSSKRIFAKEYQTKGIPFYRGKEIIERQSGNAISNELFISKDRYEEIKAKYGVPQKQELLLTSVGTLGVPYVIKEEEFYFKDGNLTWFRHFNELDVEYLYYWFLSPYGKNEINAKAIGSTQKALTINCLSKFNIKIPVKLEDQHRIASILSSLDRKIELNNKINADLEEMAQTIFKNWFVDFEPFKDGKFVDSELGMIPEGWKVISLNEILDNVSGYSYKGSELQSSNIAMATIKNFERKGGFKTEGYKEIVISKKIKETQFVDMFDVLVAHTDLTQNAEIVGNPAIVLSKGGYEKLIMSMDLTKVISKIDGITNGLLYCILSTSRFKEHALGYVNGTTVLHMSKKAVPEYTCAFPKDINQIRDLCITLDSIYKRMAVTYEETSRLSHLRDTLLPKLMSGELEVSE